MLASIPRWTRVKAFSIVFVIAVIFHEIHHLVQIVDGSAHLCRFGLGSNIYSETLRKASSFMPK
jgi:hypothetical protein